MAVMSGDDIDRLIRAAERVATALERCAVLLENPLMQMRKDGSIVTVGYAPRHASDCAIYNAPAMEKEPCDCGAEKDALAAEVAGLAGYPVTAIAEMDIAARRVTTGKPGPTP